MKIRKFTLALIISILVTSNVFAQDKSASAKVELGMYLNSFGSLMEVFGPTIVGVREEAGDIEILIAGIAQSDISTAYEALSGCVNMYRLQDLQESTSPEARGLMIYVFDGRIQTMMAIQDRLTIALENVQDQRLKQILRMAIDTNMKAKYGLKKISDTLKKEEYIPQ